MDIGLDDTGVAGWICTRLHPEGRMRESYVLAVNPDPQRRGVGAALMEQAFSRAQAAGTKMVMVETGGDPGYASTRAAYETVGFERWSVARYSERL